MKKQIVSLLVLLLIPLALAIEVDIPISASAGNNPLSILVHDSGVYTSVGGTEIIRTNNYAFTGEMFYYDVTVTDPDGAGDIDYVMIESLTCNQYDIGTNYRSYECWYTVQPSAHGNIAIEVRARDNGGNMVSTPSIIWFQNPVASLTVTGTLTLPTGTPGSTETSNILVLENDGEGGVELNMEIKGTDLYDPAHSLAMCPTTNQLALSNLDYYAERGIYNSGWTVIPYHFADMIPGNSGLIAGDTMDLTIQITYPTPCFGDYTGNIYVSGTVV